MPKIFGISIKTGKVLPNDNNKNDKKKFAWNAFAHIPYASENSPHSQTMDSSYWRKLKDTFQAIDGAISITKIVDTQTKGVKGTTLDLSFSTETRPGLFDYATLGSFRLLHWLFSKATQQSIDFRKAIKENHGIKKAGYIAIMALLYLPKVLLSLMHVIGNGIIRHAVSLAATLALSPLVLGAHLISKAVGYFKADKAANVIDMQVLTTIAAPEINAQVGNNIYTTKKIHEILKNHSLRDVVITKIDDVAADIKALAPKDAEVVFLIPREKAKEPSVVGFGQFAHNPSHRAKLIEVNKSARLAFEGKLDRRCR